MRAAVAALVVLAPAAAFADGTMPGMDMAAMDHAAAPHATLGVGVTLLAADFATMEYEGNYQGALPQVMWARGRFAAMASLGIYRLVENGREVRGIGDAMVMGSATLAEGGGAQLGAQVGVMAPTGAEADGLGMGHAMGSLVLTSAMQLDSRITLRATAGMSRALVADLGGHHHGAMPLVEPMNASEVVWSGGGDVAIAAGVRGGARVWGGVPVGATGVTRVAGALRVAWGRGKLSTGAELQAGLAGDPFGVRGLLETDVSF